jgi:hypothetical protein
LPTLHYYRSSPGLITSRIRASAGVISVSNFPQ